MFIIEMKPVEDLFKEIKILNRLSGSVWKRVIRSRAWMRRTEMSMPRRSRSKWIIDFPTGEDTGQRLRNSVSECFFIDDASSFLYIIADA